MAGHEQRRSQHTVLIQKSLVPFTKKVELSIRAILEHPRLKVYVSAFEEQHIDGNMLVEALPACIIRKIYINM